MAHLTNSRSLPVTGVDPRVNETPKIAEKLSPRLGCVGTGEAIRTPFRGACVGSHGRCGPPAHACEDVRTAFLRASIVAMSAGSETARVRSVNRGCETAGRARERTGDDSDVRRTFVSGYPDVMKRPAPREEICPAPGRVFPESHILVQLPLSGGGEGLISPVCAVAYILRVTVPGRSSNKDIVLIKCELHADFHVPKSSKGISGLRTRPGTYYNFWSRWRRREEGMEAHDRKFSDTFMTSIQDPRDAFKSPKWSATVRN